MSSGKSIHYLTHHSRDADQWPFYKELVRLGGEEHVRILTDSVNLNYRHRIELMLVGWPRMVRSAFRLMSLSNRADVRPDCIVVHEHLQLLILLTFGAAWGRLRGRKAVKHVLLNFIFTPRNSLIMSRLRQFYFRQLFYRTDLIVVHSTVESESLQGRYQSTGVKIASVLYGIGEHAEMAEHSKKLRMNLPSLRQGNTLRLFSAGRSSRDYKTLLEALRYLDFPFACRIACDLEQSFDASAQVQWLRNCFGADYARELIQSEVVVIPLLNPEISAGQMVALHALACGKPIIITDTPVTREYFDGCSAVHFVPMENPASMASGIEMVKEKLATDQLQLELAAREFYLARFTEIKYARAIHNAVDNLLNDQVASERATFHG